MAVIRARLTPGVAAIPDRGAPGLSPTLAYVVYAAGRNPEDSGSIPESGAASEEEHAVLELVANVGFAAVS